MLGTAPTNAGRRGSRGGLFLDVMSILVGTVVLAYALERAMHLSELFAVKAAAVLGAGGALLLMLAAAHLPTSNFGAANRVTLARGGLVAVLFALIGEQDLGWLAFAVAAIALSLDGLDGWLARRLRVVSDFGARFDMETDALALLAVAALVWQQGKAGAWILLAGFMRYAFVAAARLYPRLGRPLPKSWRRKAAFVAAAMALTACLAPIVTPPVGSALAIAALVILALSFAIDVVYLARPDAAMPA